MKTQKLSKFKQVPDFNLLDDPSTRKFVKTILASVAVSCTVVFNSFSVDAQTSGSTLSDSPAGETVKRQANEAANAPAKPLETHPVKSSAGGEARKPVVKQPEDKMSAARPKETQALPNFHKVTDYLYRGGEPSPDGMVQLQKMGVKTLIDLRAKTEAAHNEEELAKKLGMKYINMTMTAEAPTKKQSKAAPAPGSAAAPGMRPVNAIPQPPSIRPGAPQTVPSIRPGYPQSVPSIRPGSSMQ